MIDDLEMTELFIARLKDHLPIEAGIPKDLRRALTAKSPQTPIPPRCQVLDVLNLGDEGGIGCCLDIGGPQTEEVHIVSLTHLLFDRGDNLFKEIETSQRRRIKKIKRQQGRSF